MVQGQWIDKAIGYLGKKKAARLQQEAVAKGTELNLKKLLYVHFTMDDNLSLSEAIKARYRSMYSGVFFKRYIEGLWAMAEGIIYDMFDPDRNVVDAEAIAAEYRKKTGREFWIGDKYVSCDYGTQNPTAFLLWSKEQITSGTAAGSIIIPDAIKGSRRQTKNLLKI